MSQVLRLAIQLLGTIVLARLLTPADFGLVAMGAIVIAFGNQFAELGLGSATVQRKTLNTNLLSALFYIQFGIGLILMLLVIVTAPIVAMAFGDPRVETLTIALAPTLPILAASSQHVALLQRYAKWYRMQGLGVLSQGFGAIVAIVLCLNTDIGYWALVVQAWVAASITCGLAFAWSPWSPSRVTNWKHTFPALNYGLGVTGFNLVNGLHRQFDNMIVGALSGAAELGFYSRAYSLMMLPRTTLLKPLSTAIFPAMSRLQDDLKRWAYLFLSSVAVITIVTSLVSGLLVVYSDVIVRILLGEQWAPSIPIFQILSISMLIQPVYNASSWISFSLGKSHNMAGIAAISTAVYCLAFLLGARFGAIGVASGYTVAVFALTPLWLWWATRGTILTTKAVIMSACPPIVAATVALAAVWMTPFYTGRIEIELLRGTAFIFVYFVVLGAFWSFWPSWREKVDKIARSLFYLFIHPRYGRLRACLQARRSRL